MQRFPHLEYPDSLLPVGSASAFSKLVEESMAQETPNIVQAISEEETSG